MMSQDCGFHRARSPEQVEQRRRAILDTASEMLREAPIAAISLRELSARVGLAKSNVLRYFDSREAIFLEILDREQRDWLDELERTLGALEPGTEPFAVERAIADAVTASVVRRPLLCELVAAMGGVLERNISVEFARDFKRRANGNIARLSVLVQGAVPGLGPASAAMAAAAIVILITGLWPYAHPTDEVCAVMKEMGSPTADFMFREGMRDGLVTQFVGLRAREAAGAPPGRLFAPAAASE
ncbi:MAG: TetR/AcrR family transcriptional regulator [Segniliparus sp.]|uniref:TetR/AcrR family transcriptional regulator n=1 Tax=Segniliparus sp. TaxID=2804064 RepID=UPI003F40D2DA